MKVTGLTKNVIDFVISRLSEECRKECEVFELSPDDLRKKFYRFISMPFAVSICDDQERPCIIVALEVLGLFRWRTRFLAIDGGISRIKSSLTKFLRIFTDKIIRDTGGQIEILSAYPPQSVTGAWFKIIGFSPCDTTRSPFKYTKNGDCHVRRR